MTTHWGLGVPMSPPACDRTWVVILGSATDPATHEADVGAPLRRRPEAKYMLTEGACASLRQRTDDGARLYAVYLGPDADRAAACAVSTRIAAVCMDGRHDAAGPDAGVLIRTGPQPHGDTRPPNVTSREFP